MTANPIEMRSPPISNVFHHWGSRREDLLGMSAENENVFGNDEPENVLNVLETRPLKTHIFPTSCLILFHCISIDVDRDEKLHGNRTTGGRERERKRRKSSILSHLLGKTRENRTGWARSVRVHMNSKSQGETHSCCRSSATPSELLVWKRFQSVRVVNRGENIKPFHKWRACGSFVLTVLLAATALRSQNGLADFLTTSGSEN